MLVLNLPDFKGEQVFPMLNCISMRLIDLPGRRGSECLNERALTPFVCRWYSVYLRQRKHIERHENIRWSLMTYYRARIYISPKVRLVKRLVHSNLCWLPPKVVWIVFSILLITVTFVGNGLVIYCYLRCYRIQHDPGNLVILSLSVSDILSG